MRLEFVAASTPKSSNRKGNVHDWTLTVSITVKLNGFTDFHTIKDQADVGPFPVKARWLSIQLITSWLSLFLLSCARILNSASYELPALLGQRYGVSEFRFHYTSYLGSTYPPMAHESAYPQM